MDEKEVERIARLMHAAFIEFFVRTRPEKTRPCSFDELIEWKRDGYLAAARAILADQYAPTAVVEPARTGQ